jgi:hypothetical protein
VSFASRLAALFDSWLKENRMRYDEIRNKVAVVMILFLATLAVMSACSSRSGEDGESGQTAKAVRATLVYYAIPG